MSFQNDDNFDSKSYVKVNTRLTEFWKDHPKGRLETAFSLNDGILIMEARLYREGEDRPAATGHSFQTKLDGDKVGEYTETVAVGRALALMGYQVEKSIASEEEMTRFNNRRSSKSQDEKKAEEQAISSEKTESTPAKQAEVSDTPQVPKTLKASRIYKPLPKTGANGGVSNG